MSELQKNMIDYFVICINEVADRYRLTAKEAFEYLYEFQGLKFLENFYNIQHTLSFDDTVDSLTIVCRDNGGNLENI